MRDLLLAAWETARAKLRDEGRLDPTPSSLDVVAEYRRVGVDGPDLRRTILVRSRVECLALSDAPHCDWDWLALQLVPVKP